MSARTALLALGVLGCGALLACGTGVGARTPQRGAAGGWREAYEAAPEFGGRVHVLEAGPENAPPLVLIHGLGDGARDFDPLIGALSRAHHVLTFDLPGFGRSTKSATDYAPVRYARFIHAMIARHVRTPVALLGHSMGGALALLYAGEHPERVTRLLLLDVAGVLYYREYMREIVERARQEGSAVADQALHGARNVLLEMAMTLPLQGLVVERSVALRRLLLPSSGIATRFIQYDFGPALARVRALTWLGWGRHDEIAPQRTADALRFVLRPAVYQVFEHSGHVPMRTEPAQLSAALNAFLDSAPQPPAAPSPPGAERSGTCLRQNNLLFEGDYDSITLYKCEGAILRNVRARSVRFEQSVVELTHVELVGADVAVVVKDAVVKWTGGSIVAPVCFDADASKLDFAAVACEYTDEGIRVHSPSRLVASVSSLSRAGHRATLHGEYALPRNTEQPVPQLTPPAQP